MKPRISTAHSFRERVLVLDEADCILVVGFMKALNGIFHNYPSVDRPYYSQPPKQNLFKILQGIV